MDPASAAATGLKAYEVGGITLLLLLGIASIIFAVWRASNARETRLQAAIDKETAACKEREAAIAKRLTDVEANLITELRTSATRLQELTSRSLEVSAQVGHALENHTRVAERVLARLDRD